MDQARHIDARHAPDKSQQSVHRHPANPQKIKIVGLHDISYVDIQVRK